MSEQLPNPGYRFLGDGMASFTTFFRNDLLPRFTNDQLARQADAALLETGPGCHAMTCDSFIVDPLIFPGGNIGTLAFCGVANDLLTECARPESMLMSLMVAEDLEPSILDTVLDSLSRLCQVTGSAIVGGDTKNLPAGSPQLIISMSAVGRVGRLGSPLGFEHVEPGDSVVLTGPVGAHSIAVLSSREGLGFESVVRSDCRDLGATMLPMVRSSPHLHALRDATRGGVLAVLHELTSSHDLEVVVDVAEIPVDNEVLMACDLLGLDPLELANEGCMVLFVESTGAAAMVEALRSEYGFTRACVIGGVAETSHGVGGLVLLVRDGETRVASQSFGTGIPRLC